MSGLSSNWGASRKGDQVSRMEIFGAEYDFLSENGVTDFLTTMDRMIIALAAADDFASSPIDTRKLEELKECLGKLKFKSVEQLRIERDEAADALAGYCCGIYPKGENIHLDKFKEAKAAHLQAVGGEG